MRYVYVFAVHGNGIGGGTHLRRHRHSLNLGGNMSGGRKSENGHEQRTITQQEASPQRENAFETTVAPGDKPSIAMLFRVKLNPMPSQLDGAP
jgi:hypothetical protein